MEKKIRVYDLAKQWGVKAKEDLVPLMKELGFPDPNVMNTLDEKQVKALEKALREKGKKAQADIKVVETQVKDGVIRRRKVAEKTEAKLKEGPSLVEEAEEKEVAKKKKPAGKKAVGAKKAKAVKEKAEEKISKVKAASALAPSPGSVPEPEAIGPTEQKKATGIEILKEADKIIVPRKPKPKLHWVKPTVRFTARATDEIPSEEVLAGEPKPAEGLEIEKEKKKARKKKGAKAKLEIEEFREKLERDKKLKEPIKRKLRRKIAFKLERGMLEGVVQPFDTERMYLPQKKKIPPKKRSGVKLPPPVIKPEKRVIRMAEEIEVQELARRMGIKASAMIEKLNSLGVSAEVDGLLDYETAVLVAQEFGYQVVQEVFDEAKILEFPRKEVSEELVSRPPVVTIMGHVDHGKTSLLDYIRKTKIAEKEPGQITQSIGAWVVEGGFGKIVFIDTPGHEAFTKMRARGAKVTDLVVLVVAVDDGVMPQTVEAINHAKSAGVPIVVAINKIDLPGVNPDRVKSRLAELGLAPEEWGGETLFVQCSARTGQGVDELLESITLQAEMLNLRANPKVLARGFIIESKLEKGRGVVASVIIKEGALKLKDAVVCGIYSGRVRALFDHLGKQVQEAGPSIPVEVIGLDGVPEAGEELLAVKDEAEAKMVAGHRADKKREQSLAGPVEASLEDLLKKVQEGERVELNLIIKADTQGAVEAVKDSVLRLGAEQVQIKLVHSGCGAITENDVLLAEASKAVIIGFGVRPESKAGKIAEQKGIRIYTHRIIYELLDELSRLLKGMIAPTKKERILGRAEVRQIFNIPKVGTVAGVFVQEGVVNRGSMVRVLRDHNIVFEGRLASLKRFKDDVREVNAGYECGLSIENYNDIKPGDFLELFILEEASS